MQKETGWRTDDGRIYNNISILFPTIVQISPTPDFLSQRGEGGGIITTDNDNYMRSCHLGTLSNHHATISYSSSTARSGYPFFLAVSAATAAVRPVLLRIETEYIVSSLYITVKFRTTIATRISYTIKNISLDMFCCVYYKCSCMETDRRGPIYIHLHLIFFQIWTRVEYKSVNNQRRRRSLFFFFAISFFLYMFYIQETTNRILVVGRSRVNRPTGDGFLGRNELPTRNQVDTYISSL